MRISLRQSEPVLKLTWRRLALAAGTLLCLGLVGWMVAAQLSSKMAQGQPGPDQTVFEGKTGIRIVRVALTAADGLADLHYQVLDPDKALIVHDRDQPPTLVHEKTGAVLNTPFHGHGFHTLKAGVTYRLQLWNSGGVLQRGDRITVQMGDAHLNRVFVE